MSKHRDQTMSAAVGAADREWKEMARIALIVRSGKCNPVWAEEQEKKFTGIFARLLTDPEEQVRREARR